MREIHIVISEQTLYRGYALLLCVGAVLLAGVAHATAPNPGHLFTEVGGGVAQGDVLYGSAADTLAALPKNATASRYLSNSGTTNNPAWAQVDLTNGVTGSLPLTNGGTNASLVASNGGIVYSNASAFAVLAGTATANKVLMSSVSSAPVWSTPVYPNASATAGTVIVSDGTNYVASTPTFPNASATARKVIVSDGTNWVASTETYAVPGATVGNTLASNGTNWVSATGPGTNYHTILQSMCSHIAAKVAGTYAMGIGDPCAVSGTGTLYPLSLINYVAADYPAVNGVATKLRVRATVSVNGTAPTGNFTVGLYPVTSGAGASGLKIYTMGTLVANSAATTVTTPAASSMTNVASADFTPPADGVYALAVVTTATVATGSLVEIDAQLQQRN